MTSHSPPTLDSGERGGLFAGRAMFGRYRIQRILGRGGMGVVWLARDERLERPVAMKFLPDVCFLDAASRDDLKRETRRSLELTHPNIVRIYDFVEDEEAAAISMEYVDGATLSHLRVEKAERCFAPDELGRWVTELCRALDYAHHGAGFVHRDLKPSNLMVTSRGALKVADFGIACGLQNTAARISAWNSTGGTLGYMSPQQLAGELASPSDDLYSVGALLYELLTSKPPFHSGDISLQIRTATPPPIAQRRGELGLAGGPIPAAWEETLAACLAKQPQDRPATAREIAQRLGLETEGAAAFEITPPELLTVFDREPPAALSSAPISAPAADPGHARSNLRWWIGAGIGSALMLSALIASRWLFPATPASAGKSAAAATVAVAAAPAMVAEAPGRIVLKTEPPGARISVGEREMGVTPVTLDPVDSGAQTIRIQLSGFDDVTMPAQVQPRQTTDLGVIALRRSTGTLHIAAEPRDSSYTLLSEDGETAIREGFTPDTIPQLPTGAYRVRFARAGWPAQEKLVVIARESTQSAQHSFGKGMLEIATDPAGAQITLGGRALGQTPLRVDLPNGQQGPFTATLAGYEAASFDATIESGATLTLPPVLLKAVPPALQVLSTPPGAPFTLYASAFESPDSEAIGKGTTPSLIEDLKPGTYRIVFGGGTWPERALTVEMAERGTTPVETIFPHGTVTLESIPPGVELFADDEPLGIAPLTLLLPTGDHIFTAEYQERTARPRTVKLAADGTQTVRFDFSTSSHSTAGKKTSRTRRKPPEASTFTKIGRSISNFFTGQKPKK